jgi:hypothetical protein
MFRSFCLWTLLAFVVLFLLAYDLISTPWNHWRND